MVFFVLDCVHSFRRFLYKSLKDVGQCHQNQLIFLLKWRWGRPKVFDFSCAWLVSLVVNEKDVVRSSQDYSSWINIYFCSTAALGFACAGFHDYVWHFGSLHPAFEMSCDTEYLEKTAFDFLETWSPSFWIVCNCFDDFRTNHPKKNGRSHRKENTNFPKRRLVRSKNVCLSSALLFCLAVTTKNVLRPYWDLSTWNNACFLFKCRVTFRLRQFSKVTIGTLALYILRLRYLAIPNTSKKQLLIFPETWSSSFWIVCNCFDDFRTKPSEK